MSEKLHKKIELITNLAIIFIAILLGWFFIQQIFFPKAENRKLVGQIRVGAKVPLRNVEWSANRQTLILYVKKGCRFCTDSMPFYRELTKETSRKRTKIIAVSIDETDVINPAII